MSVEEARMEVTMAPSIQDKKKFADFVRIHAINGNLITRDDEMKILKEGITRFGMDLDEATGVLLSVAAEHDIALVSHAEHHVETLLEQFVKRGKIGQKEFNDAVAVYSKLTNNGLPESEIRRRVKQMVEEHGWRGRRTRWFFGSRKWFRKI
jgi:polyhydroxyalkanoate synthesis regulator phasin